MKLLLLFFSILATVLHDETAESTEMWSNMQVKVSTIETVHIHQYKLGFLASNGNNTTVAKLECRPFTSKLDCTICPMEDSGHVNGK